MHAASEMTEIRAAVSALRTALESVRTNTDIANTNMLRLNLREARDMLARRCVRMCNLCMHTHHTLHYTKHRHLHAF